MYKEDWILENDLEYDIDLYIPSWKGKYFTGIAYQENEFGVLVSETSYVNGKKEGYFNEYNVGRICYGFYKNDRPFGLWKYFHENEILKKTKLFCQTKKLILLKEWDLDGNLVYIKWNNRFGPYISNIYSKEQFWGAKGNLICEKISEAKVLIEQKEWDSQGKLLTYSKINPSIQRYSYWQACKSEFTVKNTFTFSK
jgi:antitoxin component YwqK of YwqJK toxin-antitoxin module